MALVPRAGLGLAIVGAMLALHLHSVYRGPGRILSLGPKGHALRQQPMRLSGQQMPGLKRNLVQLPIRWRRRSGVPPLRSDIVEGLRPDSGHHRKGAVMRPAANSSSVAEAESVIRGHGPFFKVTPKYLVNAFGMMFLLQQLVLATLWLVGLVSVQAIYLMAQLISLNGLLFSAQSIDPKFRLVDSVTTTWAYLTLTASGTFPMYDGLENAPDGPALYVCNHASWMDMPIVGVMFTRIALAKKKNPVSFDLFKVIAKEDLLKLPVLGYAISSGHHVTVNRQCRRSQIRAFRQAKEWVEGGTSLLTFPEGTRSPDGRMQSFRGGAFKIALSLGAKVVPVSLTSTHHVMPKQALLPTAPGGWFSPNNSDPAMRAPPLRVTLHPAIDTKGKKEEEIAQEVWTAISSGLPENQKPLDSTPPLKNAKTS